MQSEIDWLPYFGPMVGFAAVLALGDYAPPSAALPLMAARVAVPAGLFLYFFSKGSYPELKQGRLGSGAALDVALGIAVAALWMAPYLLFPGLRPGLDEAFDPAAAGEGSRMAMLALRLLGFAAVTPFVEELLVRSFLLRAADTYDTGQDFRELPIGRFAWRSFLVTVAWFTFTHSQWEWPVAFLTCVIYNLWLYRRKSIGALILTHAATNAALFGAVAWGSGKISDANGDFPNLWFFL
ncbi:MAG: CAAX prenyl protease-related protein [Acidobacteria bacterium]|nr:CAAX prenyl protease-related protein [Acidobacteriota bacterium]